MSDLIEREAVKEALRNRIGESIDECINNVPTVDVLEQIRAEIEALNTVDYVSISSYEGHKGARDMKDDVLQIIDKYT